MKRYITLILITVFAVSAYSQNVPQQRTCGHTAHQHALMQDADYAQAHYERQIRFDNMELQVSIEGRAQCANPTVLPMAVHFENINNPNTACLVALAQQQIQILNDDYAGTNSDITNWTNNAAASFPGVNNGEACIAFCLATNNHPAGYGLTEGQPAVTINQFTGDNAPAFSGYINIFVRNIQGGILGYSPLGGQGNGDGVTIGTSFFSSGSGCTGVSPQAPFNLGRTLTHELGHYLNLNHIWGDGPCAADDGVADTPLDDNPNYNCPSVGISSCGTTDMHMNYMDYVNDACMYMFSDGQAARMENYVASNLQNVANNYATVCNVVPVAPTADFSASPSTGCAPLATSFADNSGGSPTSWSWSFPGGSPAISSAQNPSVTYSSPGTYTATLTATNAQGSDTETMSIVVNDCSNLTCTLYDNLNNGTIILLPNPATGQAAGGYVAGHNGYGDAAKADYFTGIPANTQIDGVDYEFGFATGSGNVEFAIWADNGGTPGAELYTQTIPVSTIIADVNANNSTTIDFGGLINAPSSFFVGVKLEYGTHEIALNTNTDGDTNPTTAWELWGDNSWHPYNDGTGTNTTWEYDMAHAIYPNICSQSTTPQAPTANFSSSTVSQGCETIQIQYTDNSSNNPTSWSWTFPGGSPASSTMQNPVVAYTSAGTYNASLTATNAVGSNSTTQNGVTTVPSPISGSGTASTNTIDIGTMSGLVNFTGTSAGATSWSWDFGDNGSSTLQNPSHTYNAVGTYIVTLTITDGFCTETITVGTIVVNDTTDIEDIVGLNSMSIYPNPVSGTFYIELVSDQSLELQVEVFDAVGRKVMNGGVINVMGNTIQSMDGSKLSAGTYFVRITNGTNTATTKFLKF